MMCARYLLVSVVCCGLAVGTALAQPPAPKAGPEHEILKKLEGTWDATVQMGGQESKGTMTYKPGPGLWVIGEYQGDMGGQKFEGRSVDGFDANSKKYVNVWIDSMSQKPMNMEGSFDAEKKTLTMKGDGPDMSGNMIKYKNVTEFKDDDTMVMTMSEEGKDPMMTITYKRKK